MAETSPQQSSPLDIELAKISSPVEKAAFNYFYGMTGKEGINVLPSYTFDQFENGIAPVFDLPVSMADDFVENSGLVPNYTAELAEQNGLKDTVPLLDALRGPFVQAVHRHRQDQAVRIVAIHPSLATPYVIGRSLAAAYQTEFGEDIRPNLYIVIGAYPTVMKYEMQQSDGTMFEASPVDFGRMIANLVLTAPKTANTETDEKPVNEWMRATRANFRVRNREILSDPGNILIVHPAGRRGKRSQSVNPLDRSFYHTEYRPGGRLDYITEIIRPTFPVGVDDNLLNNPANPASTVFIMGDPRPRYPKREKHVIDLLKHSAALSSSERDIYELEGRADRIFRLGKEAVKHSADLDE